MEERFVKMGLLFMAVIILSGFIGMALEQYERNQCRITALTVNKTASEIQEICK